MNIDSSRQYQQSELPSDVFNAGSGGGGGVANFNGRAVRVGNNGNGTRSLSDLGDYGAYSQNQQNQQQASALAATQKTAQDNLFAQDKADVGNFNAENQQMSTDTNNAVMDKYHVPDLVGAVNGLDGAIKNLQFNSNGGGAQGVMSQQGMDGYLGNVQLPKFATATDALSRASSAAETEYGNLMTPEVTKGQMLNERLAREQTGFTAEQQRELDGLVATMQAGTSLTTQQLQDATSLANAEKSYQATLATIQGQLKQAQLGQQYQSLSPGELLYTLGTNNGQPQAVKIAGNSNPAVK